MAVRTCRRLSAYPELVEAAAGDPFVRWELRPGTPVQARNAHLAHPWPPARPVVTLGMYSDNAVAGPGGVRRWDAVRW